MAQLHLHELGRFWVAPCDIIIKTLVAIDQTLQLKIQDVIESSDNAFKTLERFTGAMPLGLEDSVDKQRDEK